MTEEPTPVRLKVKQKGFLGWAKNNLYFRDILMALLGIFLSLFIGTPGRIYIEMLLSDRIEFECSLPTIFTGFLLGSDSKAEKPERLFIVMEEIQVNNHGWTIENNIDIKIRGLPTDSTIAWGTRPTADDVIVRPSRQDPTGKTAVFKYNKLPPRDNVTVYLMLATRSPDTSAIISLIADKIDVSVSGAKPINSNCDGTL